MQVEPVQSTWYWTILQQAFVHLECEWAFIPRGAGVVDPGQHFREHVMLQAPGFDIRIGKPNSRDWGGLLPCTVTRQECLRCR